jgi:cell division protein FtsL
VDLEEFMTADRDEQLRNILLKASRLILTVFFVVLLVHDVFGTHGFLAMQKKKQEIDRVNSDILRLNKENADLSQQVKDLKTDPQTIRKIAREELGLAKPGEVIIKLPPALPNDSPAVKP